MQELFGPTGLPPADIAARLFHSASPERMAYLRIQARLGNQQDLALARLRQRGIEVSPEVFFQDPHPHDGSKAIYTGDALVQTASGNHRALMAWMEEGGRTSLHVHDYPEEYIKLGGELYVNMLVLENGLVVGRRRIVVPDEGLIVDEKIPHFADTEGGSPSSTLIIMQHAGNLPASEHHRQLVARLLEDADTRVIRAVDIDDRVPLVA